MIKIKHLDINTFNDFGKRSDLVIPAKYDGKKINRFDIYQKYLDEVVHFYSLKKYNDSLESYENAI